MLIYPAIDIYEGKCVRLRQGVFSEKTVYSDSPEQMAKKIVDTGLTHLHVIDLEGAQKGKVANWETLRKILDVAGLSVQVGGGIRTTDDIVRLRDLGVSRVIAGSIAVKSPSTIAGWIEQFGSSAIAVAVDVVDNGVAHSGWMEREKDDPLTFIRQFAEMGVRSFVCTDIRRDGMLSGVDSDWYRALLSSVPQIDVVIAGGISSMEDIRALDNRIAGVIVGKALYEGRVTLEELSEFRRC